MFVPEALMRDVASVLKKAGRADLVQRLEQALASPKMLTSTQTAALLGVASINTVKNWLEGGHFPSATMTPGGHWRFSEDEVLRVKAQMDALHQKNRAGDLAPPEVDDEALPLL